MKKKGGDRCHRTFKDTKEIIWTNFMPINSFKKR